MSRDLLATYSSEDFEVESVSDSPLTTTPVEIHSAEDDLLEVLLAHYHSVVADADADIELPEISTEDFHSLVRVIGVVASIGILGVLLGAVIKFVTGRHKKKKHAEAVAQFDKLFGQFEQALKSDSRSIQELWSEVEKENHAATADNNGIHSLTFTQIDLKLLTSPTEEMLEAFKISNYVFDVFLNDLRASVEKLKDLAGNFKAGTIEASHQKAEEIKRIVDSVRESSQTGFGKIKNASKLTGDTTADQTLYHAIIGLKNAIANIDHEHAKPVLANEIAAEIKRTYGEGTLTKAMGTNELFSFGEHGRDRDKFLGDLEGLQNQVKAIKTDHFQVKGNEPADKAVKQVGVAYDAAIKEVIKGIQAVNVLVHLQTRLIDREEHVMEKTETLFKKFMHVLNWIART